MNSRPVPSDYIEMLLLSLIEGTTQHPSMKRITSKQFTDLFTDVSSTNKSRPRQFARFGEVVKYDYYSDKDYTYNMTYYRHLPVFTTDASTNGWLTNAEVLLIYAAMVEAIPYIGDDSRSALWKARFEEEVMKFKDGNSRESFTGGYTQSAVPMIQEGSQRR
jgi:hypothetical protein